MKLTPMPTVGQVAHGLTSGGVNYGQGVISGVGVISNRPVFAAAPSVHVAAHLANAGHVATPTAFSGVYSRIHSGLSSVHSRGLY